MYTETEMGEEDWLAFEEDMLTYIGMVEGKSYEQAARDAHSEMVEIHSEDN